jgi:thymidine kinase
MSITLIIGSMYSGKSTTLLSYEKKFTVAKKNFVCINHSFDTRYRDEVSGRSQRDQDPKIPNDESFGSIITHDNIKSSSKTIICQNLHSLNSILDLNELDAMIIDEIQFFERNDCISFLEEWANKGKIIICGGLSGNFKKEPFETVSNIISIADHIIHLKSICSVCGNDGIYSKRLSKNEDLIVVGSDDIYQPRCRKCFSL